MQEFIKIISEDGKVPSKELSVLLSEVSEYLNKSDLLAPPGNCSGIHIIVNPDLSKYPDVKDITSKISWGFGDSKVEIPAPAWSMFSLYCINLTAHKSKNIDKLLILLKSSDVAASAKPAASGSASDSSDGDEEAPTFSSRAPMYTLDKVIMPEETHNQIDRAIALIQGRKKIFEEWGFKEVDPHTKTILCFFGAPGTGKTMCAHAIASALQKNILIASYASIESKWVGEGPKNLQKIFKDAEEQDAVLFFDEADSFLSKRVANAETGSDKHYNRMSNEMFQLLENYDGIIIFATNLVADFDKAFKSRILAFIEFRQPDYEARKKLIKTMIPSKLPLHPEFTDDSIGILAEISDGFCGREIRKAMLTTLAEGAMKGVEVFTIDEFGAGFSSVKEETLAVDKSAGGEIGGNLIFDFINECSIGSAIMDVCQYAAWQRGELTSGQKAELLRIARYLNVEAPDLTISYANKDLNDSIAKIQENHREAESLRYVCEVLANSETDADEFKAELAHLAERLNVVDNGVYLEYFNTLKSLFANLS